MLGYEYERLSLLVELVIRRGVLVSVYVGMLRFTIVGLYLPCFFAYTRNFFLGNAYTRITRFKACGYHSFSEFGILRVRCAPGTIVGFGHRSHAGVICEGRRFILLLYAVGR